MPNKNISIFILILIIATSCGLKQPDESVLKLLFGSAYVTSNLADAKIFVDYDSTGKVTPDSIQNLPIGTHVIHVFKDGYITSPDSVSFVAEYNKTFETNFSLQPINNPGTMFIDSEPEGAQIWIDSKFTGKFTPAYVTVCSGMKQVSLKKNDFNDFTFDPVNVATNDTVQLNVALSVQAQVLIESFANSSCLPCTTTNRHLETFMSAFDESKYALIEYFTNWPNFLDPMFQHNPAANSERFTYYDVRAVPSMFIAGNTVNATDYNAITAAYNSQLANVTQHVSLSLTRQITDSIKVKADLTEFNPLPSADWRLFIAVIEKEVFFSSPPGSNGLKKFSHVFRTFLTPNVGDVIAFTDSKFVKTYSGSLSAEWDLNELQVIGFIQNRDTKVVIKSSHL